MLAEYYQTELGYYRELAREFAHAFPEVAHLVSERSGDEAVERLMQGAALLTGRMRQRLDDDFPEIIQPLFDLLWAQHMRPCPAATLVQFFTRGQGMQQIHTVPRDALLLSRPIEGRVCHFRTSWDVDVTPLAVEDASMERPHPADTQLRLLLKFTGGGRFDSAHLRSIRLQLLGSPETKFALYLCMAKQCRRLSVCTPEGEVCRDFPSGDSILPSGFRDDEALLPFFPTPLPGLRLLQEFFWFPDKFLGLTIVGLEKVPRSRLTDAFRLVFHLGPYSAESLRFDAGNFATACTPAVNLSPDEPQEVPVEDRRTVYCLETKGDSEVFAVNRVIALDAQSKTRVEYLPFVSEALPEPGDDRLRYQLIRRPDGAQSTRTYLSILDLAGRPRQPGADMLHVWFNRTDGNFPLRLGLGEVDVASPASPAFVEFKSATPIVPPIPLVVGEDRHWEMLAQFAMHPKDLMSLNGLRVLLDSCRTHVTASAKPSLVSDVRTSVATRLHRRMVLPVTRVEILLERAAFVNAGESFLFARLLSVLFQDRPQTQTFTDLTVRVLPGGEVHYFPPL
jgi:type VI secretion system protein ImpG